MWLLYTGELQSFLAELEFFVNGQQHQKVTELINDSTD